MMSQQSLMCSCNVCGSVFGSRFSLKRHLGVKHMVNEDGIKITREHYEHLRRQSDKSYIRIGNRMTSTDERTTNMIPLNSKVSNDSKHAAKQLGPTIIDDLMGFENYMKTMCREADSEMKIHGEEMDDAAKSQQLRCMHGRQTDCKQVLQKQTDERIATPQNSKVSNDAKHTGKQLDPTTSDDLIGFENYMKTMLSKADSDMGFQSGGVNDAAKTRHNSPCRRGWQKDHRRLSHRQLTKYWSTY